MVTIRSVNDEYHENTEWCSAEIRFQILSQRADRGIIFKWYTMFVLGLGRLNVGLPTARAVLLNESISYLISTHKLDISRSVLDLNKKKNKNLPKQKTGKNSSNENITSANNFQTSKLKSWAHHHTGQVISGRKKKINCFLSPISSDQHLCDENALSVCA